jgi:hypothetical protein
MSELLIVKPLEPTPNAVTVTAPPQTRLQKIGGYLRRYAAFFVFAFLFLTIFAVANPAAAASATTPAPGPPAELGTWIMTGLYDGMDIIWGMSAIVMVLMIPAGLQFAVGILKGVVSSFSGFRF